MEDCIQINDKKVLVTNSLPEAKMHLKPLYDFINQGKPVKLEKILEEYNYSITDRKLYAFLDAIGGSLENMGLVEVSQTGILKNRTAYVPRTEAVHYVIDMIRAELLENVEVTEDIACLVVLLDRSKTLKTYFSEFEQKEIKNKLKEITNSSMGKMIKEMVDYVENIIAMINMMMIFYN